MDGWAARGPPVWRLTIARCHRLVHLRVCCCCRCLEAVAVGRAELVGRTGRRAGGEEMRILRWWVVWWWWGGSPGGGLVWWAAQLPTVLQQPQHTEGMVRLEVGVRLGWLWVWRAQQGRQQVPE